MIINDFHGKYLFLSNFYIGDAPVVGYPTLEHAYQAMKTNDRAERNLIRGAGTPGQAKRMGRRLTLRPDWELVKYDVMKFLIMEKFQAGSELAEMLMATGYTDLVEGNTWHDNIWGDCSCGRDACAKPGSNWLGKLLNERRMLLAEI